MESEILTPPSTSLVNSYSSDEESEETKDKDTTNEELVTLFIADAERYEKRCDSWWKISDDLIKKYCDEGKHGGDDNEPERVAFNVLWSNVQTTLPALYSRLPKVVAERRYKDKDPVGRVAAITAERAGQYAVSIDSNRFNSNMNYVVLDRLLPGRGQAWVRYEPTYEKGQDASGNPMDQVVNERAPEDYVYYKDFGHSEGRTWADVSAVWKRVHMTKTAVVKRFGKKIADSLNFSELPKDIAEEIDDAELRASYKRAVVYERWDRDRQKVYWFSKGMKEQFLDVKAPPCNFIDFFPCPEPLYATLTSKTLIPTPDYKLYRRLADDLDYITKRKSSLMEMVRLVGCHDASVNDIMLRLKAMDDGDSFPVKQWMQLAERGGLKGVMQWFPLEEVAQTINLLTNAQQDLIEKIYEVTGISDIVRGNTSPSETATAQQLKGQFATLRLSKKQADVQRFIADIIRLKVEIIFEHFSDETIMQMVGYDSFDPDDQALFPQALELLRSDKLRTFKIDIETDSTIALDEQMDKEAANEFISAVGNLFQQTFNVVQVKPELMPFMLELTKFGARRYRTGKTLEGALEKALDAITEAEKQAAENPPEEQPDPKMVEAQNKMQIAQYEAQIETQKAQHQQQIDELLANHKVALDNFKVQSDIQMKQQKLEMTAALKSRELEAKMAEQQMQAYLAANSGGAVSNQTAQQASAVAPLVPPITVNVSPAKKKVTRFVTDPTTGQRMAITDEMVMPAV